jgi:starch-binding outer membrane protein, SusD/RagB family
MLSRFHSRRVATALLALSLGPTAACNSLLDVESPGRVPVDALADPSLIPTLSAAAIQTFQCGAMAFAATGGMLSGEYWSANGFVNNHPWEWRGIVEIKANPGSCVTTRLSTFMGFYTPLQQARFQLDDAFTRAEAFTDAEVPNRGRILTEMRAYGGYAYLLLAEGMCSMTVDRGPEMTRAAVLAIAEQRFADAIAAASALSPVDASLLNMARVGRARTRLDLGNVTGAAEDAILVSAGFVRNAEFTEAVQARENRFFNLTTRNDYLSVAPAYQNMTVNGSPGVADPRVRAQDMGRNANDGVTRMWRQLKFPASTSNLPIASWAEAQLIYAEAVGGQEGLDAINRVRAANSPAVPALAGPPPAGSDFTTLVLEERRRQLFSEGQRYADMLRHNLPFTTGVNRKGQTITNLTCVPLPDVETRNNPNFGS